MWYNTDNICKSHKILHKNRNLSQNEKKSWFSDIQYYWDLEPSTKSDLISYNIFNRTFIKKCIFLQFLKCLFTLTTFICVRVCACVSISCTSFLYFSFFIGFCNFLIVFIFVTKGSRELLVLSLWTPYSHIRSVSR